MKRCCTCKIERPLGDFARNKSRPDGLQGSCRACKKLHDAKHYASNPGKQYERVKKNRIELAKFVRSIKENQPCADCGVVYHPFVMDYDHIGTDKVANISNMANDCFSRQVILKEIAKCELVCANCHRMRTYTRASVTQSGQSNRLLSDEP